ncbi:MAG: MiaB/RimO family radical SAM methylthiotransferase [Anaerolineales bacterium]|nr:MAG: MiaB/RimO family radical SAM methylthiotransferase [Anaerolineales bacterium]
MKPERKIYLDMIGCRLNQSELERIAGQVRQAGHNLVAEIGDADVAIINTCAVTAKAASDSRQMARRGFHHGVKQVILTGCWASLDPKAAAAIPGVTDVIHNDHKDQITRYILNPTGEPFDLEPAQRQPLPGARGRTRSFIKIQDGCNKHCTFCVTTLARGSARSEPVSQVLNEIQAALAGGAKEVILSGVHTGAWGADFKEGSSLEHLIQTILYHTDVPRLRISSLEPWDLADSFLNLWQDPRLCQHLHLPLQSGSSRILKRMARNTSPQRYRSLIQRIRQQYPRMAITTDLIVGFPGEGEREFEQSRSFVRDMEFSGGHVFTYSERPGTAASTFPNPVPNAARRERNRLMRAELEAASRKFQRAFLGQTLSVLWESVLACDAQGWTLSGWSSEHLRVQSYGECSWRNQIHKVRITDRLEGGILNGKVIPATFEVIQRHNP